MPLPSLRRLSLRDLTEENLRALIAEGEHSVVEFKARPPKAPRFGAAAASFANTLGGFVIIGVDDDRTIRGWDGLHDRIDVQSHLGALLRAEVDPLPPFVAERRTLDGKTLGVMRIFESADAPHIVRGTGALYVRTSAGKVPVDDQRLLLELARRGEDAEKRARGRLTSSEVVTTALRQPDEYVGRNFEEARIFQLVVRAPLTVTPSLAEWPISRVGAVWAEASAALIAGAGENASDALRRPVHAETRPRARGVVAHFRIDDLEGGDPLREGVAVADSAGVLGVMCRAKYRGTDPSIDLERYRDDVLRPMVEQLAAALHEAEGHGRAKWRLNILPPSRASLAGHAGALPARFSVAGEMSIPADDDDIRVLLNAWVRECMREAGRPDWER